jgi:eukaryotic-like serine/threonine-protein kinase
MPRDEDPGVAETLAETRPPSSAGPVSITSPAPRLSLTNFQLGEMLGRGGMGDVVLARDKAIGRDVAVKQLRSERTGPESVARFLREARVQARLEHPGIVPVYQIGQDDQGQPFFTMKRLAGMTFQQQLAAKPRPPRQRMLRVFHEACSAVEFAHSRGVVHRDLKPANIMVGDFGEVYVLDWGLARLVGERGDVDTSLGEDLSSEDGMTETGAMLGTPGFMPPEQMEDATKVGPPADVYALGAILFDILAGEPLHPAGRAAITSTLKGVAQTPAQRNPTAHVPPELDELCRECLQSEPAARPTVKQLADRLEGYLDGDRDVERRRALALAHVERARAALASGDVARRAEAMQAAGQALVLDPESTDAGEIVRRLTFEPTTEHPRELREELGASTVTLQKRQGRAAMGSFIVVLLYIVVAALNGVDNVPFAIGIGAYLVCHAAIVWRITQRPTTTNGMLYVAFGNALLAALLSRTLGSMLIVPAVTCVMSVSLTSYPLLIDRKWTVIGLLVASWVVPLVLEATGVLARTWEIVGDRVVLTSHVMAIGGTHTAVLLIASNVATFVVICLFASRLATSRRDAMQSSEIQAWHLRQLLPAAQSRS